MALARFFGFDRIDQAVSAASKVAERIAALADDVGTEVDRIHADFLADGLIREPGSRTREGDAAADTFAAAGMGDIADMLRGGL